MTAENKFLYTMCEGCANYGYITTLKPDLEIYHRDCNIEYPVLSDRQCPCINCIVKGMCNNVCRELLEYKRKSNQISLAKAKAHKYNTPLCWVKL